jgi:predicted nucleic acid-binding protein
VLTRLPGLAGRTPTAVGRLLAANFPYSRFLDEEATVDVLGRLAEAGTAGGAVHDALVAAAAAHHQVPLATRDLRALRTYRAFDVEVVAIR